MQPIDQETLSARLIEHDEALPRLRNALQTARRSC